MNKDISLNYSNDIHRTGRISSIIMIIALLAVPFSMQIIFGYKVDIGKTISASIAVLSYYGIVSIVEFISFTPILGSGGVYLASLTGNITNMKMPAALSAIQVAEVEPGTEEAEVVSVIAISVSTFVTSGILFVGMLLFGFIMPILQSPSLAPAFANIMPAMLGALAIPYLLKELKIGIVPIISAGVLTLILGANTIPSYQAILTPVFLGITVGWRYILYRKEKK